MRKTVLLVALVSIFWACQKKEYPLIKNPQVESYGHRQPSPAAKPARVTTQALPAQEHLSASTQESFTPVAGDAAAMPAEAAPAKVAPSVKETSIHPARADRAIVRKMEKKIRKAQSPEQGKSAKARVDTVSLLSLISGGLGLLLLVLGAGIGLLLGLVGLILGIVGLTRISRGVAPTSSRAMAILGVIFGGVVTLLGIIVIALVASYGFI